MMANFEPNDRTPREELRFSEITRTAFRFLIDEFGFEFVESDATYVRYHTGLVFLNVYHGRRSYEIDVEIGRLSRPDTRQYRLADVLGAIAGLEDKRETYLQASNVDSVEQGVHAAASLVRSHYGPLLRGDEFTFGVVGAYVARVDADYTREVVQRPVRDAANDAWRSKDYEKVSELYRSIRTDLTDVEKKRLDYAERKRRRNP